MLNTQPVRARRWGGRHLPGAAVVLLLLAAPAWAAEASVPEAQTSVLEAVFFYCLSATALFSGLMICLGRNIVRMAVWLFGVLASVALLYFLMGATFLGAIQFIVYAGGTLILLIFGVMLTSKSPWVRLQVRRTEVLAAAGVAVVLFAVLIGAFRAAQWPAQVATAPGFSVAQFGRSLLTTYLVPFEVVSVLLLAVMLGAAYLVRQED